MYLLRRTAARALSTTPSQSLFVKPRSITTVAPAAFRSRQQPWATSMFQRRFASDEATKSEAEIAAAQAAESFAQTTPEAPVEENLTPAQVDAQASPTDASATVGIDALEKAQEAPVRRPAKVNSGRYDSNTPPVPNNTLYVGNLYYEVTQEQLERIFSRFGALESAAIVMDNRGLSRGFAYVKFKDVKDAEVALQSLDMQVFEGRNLVVQFHKPKFAASPRDNRGNNPPSRTLFIGNMSFEMTDHDLNELFRDMRNVSDVRVAIDRRTGQPRGFAHADFIDVQSATKAREILQETVIHGRKLRVDFSKTPGNAESRNRRPDTV